jgi:hypothetical protein
VNDPVNAPAATITLAGTVTLVLLLESATLDPPVTPAELRVTVQADDPAPVTLAGLHVRLLTVGVADWMEIAPALADVGIAEPPESTVIPTTWTLAIEVGAPGAIVKATAPTTPSLMTLVFMPSSMHTVLPAPLEQKSVLPAPVPEPPAITLTDVITPEG